MFMQAQGRMTQLGLPPSHSTRAQLPRLDSYGPKHLFLQAIRRKTQLGLLPPLQHLAFPAPTR